MNNWTDESKKKATETKMENIVRKFLTPLTKEEVTALLFDFIEIESLYAYFVGNRPP